MRIRKHQAEFQAIIDGVIAGAEVRNVIVSVTPGGGKSTIPIIAGKLIAARKADALCWVVPRKALQDQGERGFQDPFFRQMFGHDLTIRSSTNEPDPCRGLNGFVTTYQAIGEDRAGMLQYEFSMRRFILILDEYHHVAQGGQWHKALAPLIASARYVVLMTGTLERGDGKQIAFTPYQADESGNLVPDLSGFRSDTAVVRYTRMDALAEAAILPVAFDLSDGKAKWRKDGVEFGVNSLAASAPKSTIKQAIFSALHTDYAVAMLSRGVRHWEKYRRETNPGGRLLVVADGIKNAEKFTSLLKSEWGLNAAIATSHDDKNAIESIKRFKFGAIDILVTIAMAYEGLDVPAISHIIALTHIRSTPWIEQMIARAVRINPEAGPYETQFGFIFAPDDTFFREIVARIEAEQVAAAKMRGIPRPSFRKPRQAELFGNPNGIEPIESDITRSRDIAMGEHIAKPPVPMRIKTPSEIETELRDEIESHIRNYAFNNRYSEKELNTRLKKRFGKSRTEMTIPELRMVLDHVRDALPKDRRRGTGRPRVKRQAVRWVA